MDTLQDAPPQYVHMHFWNNRADAMTQIKKKPNRTSEIIQWWWVVLTDGAQTRIHCWTFSLMLFKFVRRLLCPQRAVSTATPRVGLLHLNSGPCSEPTEDRTTAWRGEEDAAYITSTLRALTQSMLMGSFFFFPRCWTFDMNLSTTLSPPYYIHPDPDSKDALHVYVYFYINDCICSCICETWRG